MILRRERAAPTTTTAVLAGIGRPVPPPDDRPTSIEFELAKTEHRLRLAERFPEGAGRG
jgi:hypothetical protein